MIISIFKSLLSNTLLSLRMLLMCLLKETGYFSRYKAAPKRERPIWWVHINRVGFVLIKEFQLVIRIFRSVIINLISSREIDCAYTRLCLYSSISVGVLFFFAIKASSLWSIKPASSRMPQYISLPGWIISKPNWLLRASNLCSFFTSVSRIFSC